ncbi:MAG: phosphate signaling complex protein PhoU [Bacteroidota bacterium]|jgi:phosphate transport system protein|nr:phosphate signaling complex protein PhoU [Bacteroidota bacterium]
MTNSEIRNTERLRRKLLQLSAIVEETTRRSVIAFRQRDRAAASEIIRIDDEINEMEIAVEEDCIALLEEASHPVGEVRAIVAVLKINSDLERIADLATNIARRVLDLGFHEQAPFPPELLRLADRTIEMVTGSLDSLAQLDPLLARRICAMDEEVDTLNRGMYLVVKERIASDAAQTEMLINFLSISRYLERIADYATNIAENVVFIGEGSIIRHQHHSHD